MYFSFEIADRISTDRVIADCRSVAELVIWFDSSRTQIDDDEFEELTKEINLDSGGGVTFVRNSDSIVVRMNPVVTYAEYDSEEACRQIVQFLEEARLD